MSRDDEDGSQNAVAIVAGAATRVAREDNVHDEATLRVLRAAVQELRYENVLNEIAKLVGADPRDPVGILVHVRERLRALERSERRMLALEKRLEFVRAAADGDPEIKRITITRRIAPPVTLDEDVE